METFTDFSTLPLTNNLRKCMFHLQYNCLYWNYQENPILFGATSTFSSKMVCSEDNWGWRRYICMCMYISKSSKNVLIAFYVSRGMQKVPMVYANCKGEVLPARPRGLKRTFIVHPNYVWSLRNLHAQNLGPSSSSLFRDTLTIILHGLAHLFV